MSKIVIIWQSSLKLQSITFGTPFLSLYRITGSGTGSPIQAGDHSGLY